MLHDEEKIVTRRGKNCYVTRKILLRDEENNCYATRTQMLHEEEKIVEDKEKNFMRQTGHVPSRPSYLLTYIMEDLHFVFFVITSP